MTARIMVAIALLAARSAWTSAQTTAPADYETRLNHAKHLLDANAKAGETALKQLIEETTQISREKPQDAVNWFILGRAYFYLGQDDRAIEAFDSGIAVAPTHPGLHFLKGLALRYADKPEDAVVELQKAAELKPDDVRHWHELGVTYAVMERHSKALEALRKAIQLQPSNADALSLAGTELLELGKADEALVMLHRAVEADPNRLIAWYNIGQTYQNQGKYAESLQAFEQVVALRPDDWRALAKVVQNNAAIGNAAARDKARESLFKLHTDGKINQDFYCREQFKSGEHRVMALEYFELAGKRAVRYSFQVLGKDAAKPEYRVSLGSYDETTEHARATGDIPADARLWHLDGYYAGGVHKTFAFFKSEPSYDETRKLVVKVVEGQMEEMSSLTPTTQGGEIQINVR